MDINVKQVQAVTVVEIGGELNGQHRGRGPDKDPAAGDAQQ